MTHPSTRPDSHAPAPRGPAPALVPNGGMVMVVDDEADIVQMISGPLRQAGFSVIAAEDGAAALEKARAVHPAVILLDVMIPSLSGFEVCKLLKNSARTADIKIILVSAKHEEVDRLLGFELGADDYVVKPFSVRELVHRVKSVLKRTSAAHERDVLTLGSIRIDFAGYRVCVEGKPVSLTAREFKLLAVLAKRHGVVQSRDTLLFEVWGDEEAIDSRSVDTYLKRLRNKLGSAAGYIKTVHGFGYRISLSD